MNEKLGIYLAGGIAHLSDEEIFAWRKQANEALRDEFTIYDPTVRDYRGIEDQNVNNIVEFDKRDIDLSSILLINFKNYFRPSIGTSMEIIYAWERNKINILVIPEKKYSPWLKYHSHIIVSNLEDGIEECQKLKSRSLISNFLATMNLENKPVLQTS